MSDLIPRPQTATGALCAAVPGLMLVLVLAMDGSARCRAATIIEVPNVSAAPGTSGTFDVTLIDTDSSGSPTYHVAADVVELSLSGLPGVTFTAASIATSTPYVYAESGTTLGVPFVDSTTYPFPNEHFLASDSEFAAPFYRTVGPGASFGLVQVSYTVSSGAVAGPRTIQLGSNTSLSDDQFNLIGFQATAGSFTVVPEPRSLILAAIGFGCAFLTRAPRQSGQSSGLPMA